VPVSRMWALKLTRSTMAASRGSGNTVPHSSGAGQPDGGFLVAFGDDLEQQFGAAGVEADVAEFVQLCGCPHRSTYADPATMPRDCVARL
jgi:hypothetical protein